MRLPALLSAAPVDVPDDTECHDCQADDGPWAASFVLDNLPTCTRCLVEIGLVGP